MANEYTDLIKQQQTENLQSSMYVGTQQNPDTEASLQKLADRVGLPVDAVRQNKAQVEAYSRLSAFDVDSTLKNNPKLAAWLMEPGNAAVAHDDTKSLGLLEGALNLGKAPFSGALTAVGGGIAGIGDLYGVATRTIDRGLEKVLPQSAMDVLHAKVVPWYLDPQQALMTRPGKTLLAGADALKAPKDQQSLATDVAEGIGQLAGQIGMYLVTGPATASAMMFGQGAHIMADKTAKDIADPAMKDAAIIAGGAITAITEKYGLDKILNRVPPEIKNRTLRFLADKLAAGGIEAAQEFSEGLLHDLARKMLTNKDAEVLDGVGREMTAAGLSAMIVRTALGVKGHRAATQNEEQFRAILDASKQSALLERYPDKFRQYVESITKDGPIENVFIPADQFRTYFQDANIDPAVMASKLGVQNYAEAVDTGGDVVIPTANFLSDLASTDHLQGLSQDIKFNQGDWTPREAKNWRDNQGDQEIDLETLKRMTGVDVTAVDGFEEMKQQMIGELAGRFDASTANAYATNYAAAITTLAQRMGMKPADLADRYRLSVNMPLPKGLKTLLDKVDVDIDPLLERLRSGDIPADQLAFGQSLFEFIRDAGGLQETGETKDLSAAVDRKPGQKKLVQKNGMSLDAALQAAIEAGYFPEGAQDLTESDLLDALGSDLAGSRVYSAKNEDQTTASMNRTLRSLSDWLDTIGADVKTMSNAQIRALVEKSAVDGVGDVYQQSDDGLQLFHGGNAGITEIKDGGPGNRFGGLFASGSRESAASHGDGTIYRMSLQDEEVLTQDALEDMDSEVVSAALYKSMPWLKEEDFEIAYEAVVDDRSERVDADDLMRVFREDSEGEASWEAQRVRGQLAKNLGFKAVEMSDEHGISYLVLPGVGISDVSDVGDVYNQSAQTDSDAFRNWFGDSKVVDAEGRPLVVYHGTGKDFSEFQEGKRQTQYGGGFYFGRDPKVASSFASPLRGPSPNVMPVYLSLQNPFIETGDYTKTPKVPKLKEQGYDGIIAQDGQIIAFYPEQIKSAIGNSGAFDPANPNILYQGKPQGPRGRITVNNDHSMQISLFENANLSTMLHELGHFYLEVMGDLATDANAPQQIKDDYQAIRNWMGLAEGDSIEVVHHEMFARANEAYLMEGKAPNPELHGVFQRFKAWMTQIYKKLHALNVPMSDDIRGVFDRIYATDEQIDAARQEGIYNESFATAADAGMTDAEFKAYQRAVEQTVERGKERLQKKLMDEYQREQDKQWRINRKAMRDEVEKEVDAQPVYVALKALSTGETEDGLTVKLDYKELKALYGKDFTHALPKSGGRAVYATKGAPSIDLETAAEVLGFDSGRAMIEQLVNMQPHDALVESETDRRMREMYGDIRFDGTFADQANLALHNDARENMLKIELRAIRKKAQEVGAINRAVKSEQAQAVAAGEQMVKDSLPQKERTGRTKDGREYQFMAFDPEPMKRAAAGLIGQKQVRDVRPYGYLLAERKAAQAFAKAMKDGDYMMAAEQKQRELFNHYLYREASAVAEEVKKKAEYLADQGTKKQREKLGKAGANYLDQVDAILERYEFKDVSLSQLDRRESLAQFVAQQEAMGNAVSIPEELLDEARQVNWKSIPVDELRAVYDSVKNIKHLSGLKNELLVADKKRKFEDVVGSLLTSIETSGLKANSEAPQLNEFEKGAIDRIKGQFKRWDSALLKAEQIFQWFDGGDPTGPWSRTLMGMAADAQNKEYDLHKQVTMSLNEIRKAMPDGWRKSLGDKVGFEIPIVDGNGVLTNANPTRYTMLSIALNMGNEQNMQRLRDGNRLDDSHFQKIRENMTQADWQFVQGVWDSIEGLWPEMAALEKRASGLEPVKVKAESFEVDGVTYRGGYFPLVYDSKISKVGEKQVESAQTVDQFLSSGVGRPTTNKGATKARQATVNQPLKLDMNNVLGSHISKVVKDISHREAISGIHRILSDSRIKTAIQERMGDAYYQELRNWNAALVADNTGTLTASNDFARFAIKARTNLSIAVMGWKFGTALSQFGGLPVALDIVKARHLATAASKFATSPLASYAMVTEKSGEMRGRLQNRDRDVREALYKLADKQDLKSDIQRSAFIMTGMADLAVAVPTWMAGYEQAITEGKSEADAVAFGDHAVRMSQGGGGAKDLAGVQRNNEFLKIMTMFYTPFSALYARLRDIGHTTAVEGVGYLPMAVARFAAVAIFPAIISQVLAGRGPDDDEDKVWWAVRQMITYPMAAIPIVRDFAGLVEQQVIKATGEGKMDYAPSYSLSPISQAIGKAYKALLENPLAVATGQKEFDAQMGWKAVESAGFVFGLPTSQVSVSGSYLLDLMNGDANPENAWEIVRDFLFRRKKE